MEKRLLFQVEDDYKSKVLNELYMTARYTRNPRQRETAQSLIAELCDLLDTACIDLIQDIQRSHRLPCLEQDNRENTC